MKLPGRDDDNESKATDISDYPGVTVLNGPPIQAEQIPAPPKLFDVAEIERRLVPFKADIKRLCDIAEKLKIETDADFERAAEMTGQAKAINKAIDGAVRAVVTPYYDFYKTGLNTGKALTNRVDNGVLARLKSKSDGYAYQKELDRRAAEKKAKDEAAAFQKKLDADAKKKGVAPVKMQTAPVVKAETGPVKTQSGSMSVKMVWDFEFTDFKTKAIFDYVLKVCAGEYIKVAEKAIKKMVKAGMHEGIDGVRFFERAETKHRAR